MLPSPKRVHRSFFVLSVALSLQTDVWICWQKSSPGLPVKSSAAHHFFFLSLVVRSLSLPPFSVALYIRLDKFRQTLRARLPLSLALLFFIATLYDFSTTHHLSFRRSAPFPKSSTLVILFPVSLSLRIDFRGVKQNRGRSLEWQMSFHAYFQSAFIQSTRLTGASP